MRFRRDRPEGTGSVYRKLEFIKTVTTRDRCNKESELQRGNEGLRVGRFLVVHVRVSRFRATNLFILSEWPVAIVKAAIYFE